MSPADKRVLVTGANGYIASQLVPRLLQAGYPVRCMLRSVHKIAHQPWINQVETVAADVSDPTTLGPAMEGVHTAYYLIHNMSRGHGYQRIELASAANFAQAAHRAGVQHIIYLGGLADPTADIAPHMRSRIETGIELRRHPVPVTEFRAGVIVGPGSISFEMIRFLCEQFPILIGPNWLDNHTQPISSQNVVDYLMAALENHGGHGEVFEIGGPEVYSYGETMLIYGQERGLRRRLITFPLLPTTVMAFFVDRLTPVPAAIAYPLIQGLRSHSVVTDIRAREVFPEVSLHAYHPALTDALARLHPTKLEPHWRAIEEDYRAFKSEGFLIQTRQTLISQPVDQLFSRLVAWVADTSLPVVEEYSGSKKILIEECQDRRGNCWIEWEFQSDSASTTRLRQTAFFAPRGLVGFLSAVFWKSRCRKIFRQVNDLLA